MKKVILVIPAYNEEKILEDSIIRLNDYLNDLDKQKLGYDVKIIIANNASIDRTQEIAENLSRRFSRVKAVHLEFKGRSNALKHIWTSFDADIHAYCDADLATDINCLKGLFEEVLNGNNIVIANRYLKDSKTKRDIKRLIYSKIYIYLVRLFFRTKISDFQCGFKAVDKTIVDVLIPKTRDKKFFFDTELLLLAEEKKYKIKQIPVKWKEMRVKESKVNIIDTGFDYIKNIILLRRRLLRKY